MSLSTSAIIWICLFIIGVIICCIRKFYFGIYSLAIISLIISIQFLGADINCRGFNKYEYITFTSKSTATVTTRANLFVPYIYVSYDIVHKDGCWKTMDIMKRMPLLEEKINYDYEIKFGTKIKD